MSEGHDVRDHCDGCGGAVTWIDEAWLCPNGCTYCADCEEVVVSCPACSQPLESLRRARAIGR